MNIKKILREPLLYLLLLSILAIIGFAPPKFSINNAVLTINGEKTRNIELPFFQDFPQGKKLHIAFNLHSNTTLVSVLYNFVPDDCIEEMKVNGNIVSLPPRDRGCNYASEGIVLDLSNYLVSGNNSIECVINNAGGGPGGLRLNLLLKPWLRIAHLLSIFLFFLTVFLILRKYKLIKFKYLLPALLFIGAFLRLYKLGSVPGGLNQDEAASLYNAYTLLKWGIDYAGNSFPVHLTSFNAGQFPLVAYLSMPFVALFDLNAFSIRIFPALFNSACLFVLFLLSKKMAGERFAIISLFLLVISPWHILLSRWALETAILPGIVLISVWLFILAQDKKVPLFLPCSVLCLSFYAYGAAVMFTPLFLVFYFAYAIYKKHFTLKQWLVAIICCIIIVAPFALFVIINKYNLQPMTIGFLTIPKLPAGFDHYSSKADIAWLESARRLVEIVFLEGKDGLPWNSVNGVHNLYLLSLPLFAYGAVRGVYDYFKNKNEILFLMLLWLLLSLAIASFFDSNINRNCLVYIPIIFFAAYGFSNVFEKAKDFGYVLIAFYCILFLHFNSIYYGKWDENIRDSFFYSYIDAIKYANENTDLNAPIYVTDRVNQPYIHVLVATKHDVRNFIETADIPNRNTAVFHSVRSFGRYKFGVNRESWVNGKAVIVRNNETKSISFPYLVNNIPQNEVFSVSFQLSVKEKPIKLNIIPDDCIQEILINDNVFPIAGVKGLCDTQKGVNLDFSEHVIYGLNHFNLRIDNRGGGPSGLNAVINAKKQLSFMHYVFAALLLTTLSLMLWKLRNSEMGFKLILSFIASFIFWLIAHNSSATPEIIPASSITFLAAIFLIASLIFVPNKQVNRTTFIFILIMLAAFMLVRGSLLYFKSVDYNNFLTPWLAQMHKLSLKEAISAKIGDYNMPYLYILAFISRSEINSLFLIKLVSIAFDVVLAYYAMKIVSIKFENVNIQIAAFMATLAIPTVILNGAFWAQCDVIYAALILASLYYGFANKGIRSLIFFGLAFSFKLQTIFIAPVLIMFLFLEKIKVKHLWVPFLTFFATLVPALIAGKPFKETILIYYEQTHSYPNMVLNTPNIYSLLGNVKFENFNFAAIMLTGMAVSSLLYFLYINRKKITTTTDYVSIAFVFSLIMPMLLPRMHERYFFLADVLSVIFVFFNKKRWYFAPIIIIGSYMTYVRFLQGREYLIPIEYASLIMVFVTLVAIKDLVERFRVAN